MGSTFGQQIKRINGEISGRLTDCAVTFGASHGWLPSLGLVIGENIAVRAMVEEPYEIGLDVEGYQPSVTFETLTETDAGSFSPDNPRQDDRLIIERDAEPGYVRIVYRIRQVQHDGQGMTTCLLHALGPLNDDANQQIIGYPIEYGYSYGGEIFHGYADLNVPRS